MNTGEIKVPISRSRTNLPVICEEGGGMTNTGIATVICGKDGSKLKPIFVATRGTLACAQHAFFVIRLGYKVVKVSRYRELIETVVYEVIAVNGEEATLRPISWCSQGKWLESPEWGAEGLQGGPIHEAIRAAVDKTMCYHCREPHYSLPIVKK